MTAMIELDNMIIQLAFAELGYPDDLINAFVSKTAEGANLGEQDSIEIRNRAIEEFALINKDQDIADLLSYRRIAVQSEQVLTDLAALKQLIALADTKPSNEFSARMELKRLANTLSGIKTTTSS